MLKKRREEYKRIRLLGQGATGRAYLVQSTIDNALYVMKRIPLNSFSPQMRQMVKNEAIVHNSLCHPNIIAFKQMYYTPDEKMCIIMEYAQKGDLECFIAAQSQPLPESVVISIWIQICKGVGAMHKAHIIHRDLKCANILICADGRVKVGDFGISKVLEMSQIVCKSLAGTPYYLCPEIVDGRPYTIKADMWALGVILYNLCALRLPFIANSLPALALKISKGVYPPFTNYSPLLKTVCQELLQIDPKLRPSCDQIVQKLTVSQLKSQFDNAPKSKNKLKNDHFSSKNEKNEILYSPFKNDTKILPNLRLEKEKKKKTHFSQKNDNDSYLDQKIKKDNLSAQQIKQNNYSNERKQKIDYINQKNLSKLQFDSFYYNSKKINMLQQTRSKEPPSFQKIISLQKLKQPSLIKRHKSVVQFCQKQQQYQKKEQIRQNYQKKKIKKNSPKRFKKENNIDLAINSNIESVPSNYLIDKSNDKKQKIYLQNIQNIQQRQQFQWYEQKIQPVKQEIFFQNFARIERNFQNANIFNSIIAQQNIFSYAKISSTEDILQFDLARKQLKQYREQLQKKQLFHQSLYYMIGNIQQKTVADMKKLLKEKLGMDNYIEIRSLLTQHV